MADFGQFRGFGDKLFQGQLPTQLGKIGSEAFGYDLDSIAFFNRVTAAGGSLSITEQDAIDFLVKDLKNYSIWSKMKAIYPMVGASAAACAQNLKSSSFTGTFTSGWTFASTGAKPNGTSAYMNTGLIPNGNLSLNSTHISSYVRDSPNNYLLGVDVSSRLWMSFINGRYLQINNGTVAGSETTTTNKGHWLGSRISSTGTVLYNNGTNNLTLTVNSGVLDTDNIFLACRNAGTGGNGFSNSEIAFSSIGDGLTDTEVSNFYTAVQAFQTTLSRQV